MSIASSIRQVPYFLMSYILIMKANTKLYRKALCSFEEKKLKRIFQVLNVSTNNKKKAKKKSLI